MTFTACDGECCDIIGDSLYEAMVAGLTCDAVYVDESNVFDAIQDVMPEFRRCANLIWRMEALSARPN